MSDVDRLVEIITQRVQERLGSRPAAKLAVLPRDRGPCDDDSAPGEDCASCGSCVVRRPWSVRAMEEVGALRVGAMTPTAKAYEAREAVRQGAREIDMVLNIGAMKSRDYETVFEDICRVVKASQPAGVKVILETSALTHEEKIIATSLSKLAGAAFVKTSTGFGKGGATVEDVQLMRSIVGSELGVKASGGVRTAEDAIKMAQAGANRLGASASVAIVTGKADSKKGY